MIRRDFLKTLGTTAASFPFVSPMQLAGNMRKLPVPSPQQLEWQEMELGMFFHFDLYPYRPEWQWRSFENLPDPNVYQPTRMDTDQWMEAAQAMGAKYAVMVAKHCTGFLQWQTDLYPYGVKQTSWKNGKADPVESFINSCHKYGIKPGLYASVTANAWWEVDNPGLVNRGKGGNEEKQKRYNRVCEQMLTELWTRYGELFEIWFDGGAIPVEEGGPDIIPLIDKYQPNALIFQGPRAHIRWVGNEEGVAPYPCWSTVSELNDKGPGDPNGSIWQPAECDVPIRDKEWFWMPDEEHKVHSVEKLVDMYYRSVGRNCNLLLNANPDPSGLIPEPDFSRYEAFGKAIRQRFAHPIASTSGKGKSVSLSFRQSTPINHAVIMEDIRQGERIRAYNLEVRRTDGKWIKVASGSAVGHKRIEQFDTINADQLRFTIQESVRQPLINKLAVFKS